MGLKTYFPGIYTTPFSITFEIFAILIAAEWKATLLKETAKRIIEINTKSPMIKNDTVQAQHLLAICFILI
jgi:hypothetical protein